MTTVSTITCVFTGFSDIKAYPDKSSESYLDHIKDFIRTFGPPEKICADGAYYGGVFQQFCEDMQIKLSIIPAYYPQGNGIAEDCQKRVKMLLAKFTSSDPSTWSSELWRIEFIINNNLRTRLGTTPYYAVFHQHPSVPGQESDANDEPPDDSKDLERLKNRIDRITPIEMDALLMRLDKYADKRDLRFEKRRTQVLQPGMWVRVIEHDPNARKTATRASEAFEVAAVLPGRKIILFDNGSPRGILTDGNNIGLVFHTSWLKVAPKPTRYEAIAENRYAGSASADNKLAVFGPTAPTVTTQPSSSPGTSVNDAPGLSAGTAASGQADYAIQAIKARKVVNGLTFYKVDWEPSWVPAHNVDPNAVDTFNRNLSTGKRISGSSSH
jgi:hypothetical protein